MANIINARLNYDIYLSTVRCQEHMPLLPNHQCSNHAEGQKYVSTLLNQTCDMHLVHKVIH